MCIFLRVTAGEHILVTLISLLLICIIYLESIRVLDSCDLVQTIDLVLIVVLYSPFDNLRVIYFHADVNISVLLL